MRFDYSKLKGKIIEVFGSQEAYAEKMNLSNTAISNKLNNKVPFSQPDIYKTLDLLNVKSSDLNFAQCLKDYFFTPKVENIQQNNDELVKELDNFSKELENEK